MLTLHGIRNCDTVKKARAWIEARGVDYRFRDYKTEPPTRAELEGWAKAFDWQKLINRAGTTFRKLPDAEKTDLTEAKAIALMLAHPSVIKRPLVEGPKGGLLGFDQGAWAKAQLFT